MTVSADEFIRRFLVHVLPKAFVRIRHFGFMANYRRSASLELCRQRLGMAPIIRSTQISLIGPCWTCPKCGGAMLVRSGALDVVVIDSVAALTPRAEIEGEMGDTHVGLQARLMGGVAAIDAPPGWPDVGTHEHRPVAHLSVGNPHTVVAVDDVGAVDLLAIGQQLPSVNLEIVEPGPERSAITMRVHERGAGITEACGTGACAAAWAAAQWGLVAGDGEITVHMDGGDAKVRLDQPQPGRVTLIGPATFVGTVQVEW